MSKIKILKASPFYPQVTSQLYANTPSLSSASYQEQYKATMETLFGWADFWKINLEKTAKFEVVEIVLNNEHLQKKWAEEHKVTFSAENWVLDILEAQLRHYQPDVFFAHDYWYINNSFLEKIKKEIPTIRLIMGWDGLLKNDLAFYEQWDMILTPAKSTADFYTQSGKLSYHFPFGFETSILDKIDKQQNFLYGLSFIGSIIMQQHYHLKRFHLLGYVAGKFPLYLWASSFIQKEQQEQWQPFRYLQRQRLKQGKWREWLYVWRLASINKGELFGKEMYQALYNSKITLNTHIDLANNNAVNIRLYEATGIGTCLVTDWKQGIEDIFKPDEEIITFKTKEECADKIKYLLKNEKEREKIAQAGQKKTLTHYSFEQRVKDFEKYLRNFV